MHTGSLQNPTYPSGGCSVRVAWVVTKVLLSDLDHVSGDTVTILASEWEGRLSSHGRLAGGSGGGSWSRSSDLVLDSSEQADSRSW